MEKLNPILVVDLNSIHNKKGNIRKIDFYWELGNPRVFRCSHCGIDEIIYDTLPYSVLKPLKAKERSLYNTVKFTYNTSPRGAHSFTIDDAKAVYRNTSFPNSYKGWGSYPDEAFLKLSFPRWTDELIDFYAVRNYDCKDFKTLGVINAGNSGTWTIVVNESFNTQKFEIEEKFFVHLSCVKKAHKQADEQIKEQLEELAG